MLRRLFRCAVRLHPASFRRRFGEEMLCIFDQQRGTPAAITVTLDCFLSLLRQWMLRPNGGAELPAPPLRTPAADHIPLFESLDPFQPRTSAIIHGALLSLILFYMTVISIPYSWIHILNPRFPEAGVTSRQRTGAQTRLPVDVIPAEPGDLSSKDSASGIPGTDASAPRVRIWLDSYVGTYISNHPPAQISIQIEGDPGASHLSVSLAGLGHSGFALSPASPTNFLIAGVPNSYVVFTADVQGRICCLSWVVNGHATKARRQ